MTLDDLIHWAADNPLDAEVVAEFCIREGISTEEFCDRITRAVAVGYEAARYSFEFCDGVVNEVYSYMLRTHDVIPPPYSMSVFLAFDEGEYTHAGDPPGASSEELYTRPQIIKILARGEMVEPDDGP